MSSPSPHHGQEPETTVGSKAGARESERAARSMRRAARPRSRGGEGDGGGEPALPRRARRDGAPDRGLRRREPVARHRRRARRLHGGQRRRRAIQRNCGVQWELLWKRSFCAVGLSVGQLVLPVRGLGEPISNETLEQAAHRRVRPGEHGDGPGMRDPLPHRVSRADPAPVPLAAGRRPGQRFRPPGIAPGARCPGGRRLQGSSRASLASCQERRLCLRRAAWTAAMIEPSREEASEGPAGPPCNAAPPARRAREEEAAPSARRALHPLALPARFATFRVSCSSRGQIAIGGRP